MNLQINNLSLFRPVEEDEIFHRMLKLIKLSRNIGSSLNMLREFTGEYARLFALLAESAELSTEPVVGSPWQNHLLNLILDSENTFSRKAEAAPPEAMGPTLKLAAAKDLRCLQELYQIDAQKLLQSYADKTSPMVKEDSNLACEELLSWSEGLQPLPSGQLTALQVRRHEMKKALALAEDWGEAADRLAAFFRFTGSGIFGRYPAFRWVVGPAGGRLIGILQPDAVRLGDLIGCEDQKQVVTENTARFIRSLPANNVLLYGDRGTGKSSTVKALLREYTADGLRIVEVARQDLGSLPDLISILQPRTQKFIIFIDDLSFDDHEGEYRHLKAVLEGSLAARPANVLLYATSNRRHLIREFFSDRPEPSDEIRSQDTVQEKLSLADRFGLTVTYTTPDQDSYLAIVEAMVRQRGLAVAPGELREMAVRWELRYNGRSGRTARQFVDWLEGSCYNNG